MEFNDCCSFSQYRHTPADLTLPWEQRICADIFGEPSEELLPQCVSLPEDQTQQDASSGTFRSEACWYGNQLSMQSTSLLSRVADISYFERKHQSLDSACGQWLRILSINWSAFGIGEQVANGLQADHSGQTATEVLNLSV